MNAIAPAETRAGRDLITHLESEVARCQAAIDAKPRTAVVERTLWTGWRDGFWAALRLARYAVPRIEDEVVRRVERGDT